MRIALLLPTYWPEVRRGSERLAHDLGDALADRGHEVSLLTTSPGRRSIAREGSLDVVRARRAPRVPGVAWYDEHVSSAPAAVIELLRGRFDVAHALHPVSACAAALARRLGGPPFVFSVHGIVNREYLVRRRYRLEMFDAAIAAAEATTALSQAGAAALRRLFGVDAEVMPGGVVSAHYRGPVERAPEPTLLCPASLDDPQKRAEVLFAAFEELRGHEPAARLLLAGAGSGAAPRGVPDGVETAPAASTAALAGAYRRAWATVLPSIDEAFGLVLLESLAAGTPVVAARSGAGPEIVDDDAVGRLFRADDATALAEAMSEALALGRAPGTVGACRAHAGRWEWAGVAERYEELLGRACGAV